MNTHELHSNPYPRLLYRWQILLMDIYTPPIKFLKFIFIFKAIFFSAEIHVQPSSGPKPYAGQYQEYSD